MTEPFSDQADNKATARAWFTELRDRLCGAFEALEDALTGQHADRSPGRFERKNWERPGGGGGTMALMHGRVFEKVGVNISTVFGEFSQEFRKQIPGADDGRFWATGISLVAHMHSPKVPAAHMNTRHIITKDRAWFGGGGDLTPIFPDAADTDSFHQALKQACDTHDPSYYPRFKKWCDEYFFLPHRNEPRGVGGIFFDDLRDRDFNANFNFTKDIGLAFLSAYPAIVERHMNEPWSAAEREQQLIRRGRYVEFNLLYDRGTQFGLRTGGNVEAILMSLPPEVRWP